MSIMRNMTAIWIVISATQLFADDWPQWMGPNRDGIWHEYGIVDRFPADGLKVRWRVPVQGGYAGPAVAGGRVYVTDYARASGDTSNSPSRRNRLTGKERVQCLDAETGNTLWKHEYDCPYEVSYPAGPRATPTVHDGRVYSLGTEGDLYCLDAKTGQVQWEKKLKQAYNAKAPVWGFCGHPLIDGDKLICLVGGEGSLVVAFDRLTGDEIWKAGTSKDAGYCPPSIIEAGGTRQLILWDPEKINSLNPDTGETYWTVPLRPDYDMSIIAPQKFGDYLFASGIGNVSLLLKLDREKPAAEEILRGSGTTSVYCANSTPHIVDGTIYGVCCRNGQLRGGDLMTGKRLWESFAPTTNNRRAGHATAFLVRHTDRWFIFSETGDLIQAKLSRDGYEELGRFHVLEPTGEAFGRSVVWSHPAFANRCVFARNDKEIVCVSLAAE